MSPYYLCFGLLDFAGKSPEIRIVATALSRNLRAIGSTVIFMIIIVYIYSVWGYKYMAEHYWYMDFNEEKNPICTSLLQCFVAALNDGLRANDLGASIERLRSPDIVALDFDDYLKYYMQALQAFSYWFVVCIILLNVIFGIIIDSFGELRHHRAMIQGKIDNECFICGIDRFTFDTKGNGFDTHVEVEHQKWNYLFMLVMLREKDSTEYNGWEQFVAELIPPARSPPMSTFLPRNTAISLQEHQEREEAESRQQVERAERTAKLVEDIATAVESVRVRQDDAEKKLSKLLEAERARHEVTLGSPTLNTAGVAVAAVGRMSSMPSPR